MAFLSLQAPASSPAEACVRRYAEIVAREYADSLRRAEEMRAAIRAFCEVPSEAGLARARESWVAARDEYGRSRQHRRPEEDVHGNAVRKRRLGHHERQHQPASTPGGCVGRCDLVCHGAATWSARPVGTVCF